MNTINRELSIRLEPYLKNMETEYSYKPDLVDRIPNKYFVLKGYMSGVGDIKTLTLEDAIEFIPHWIENIGALFMGKRKYKKNSEFYCFIEYVLGNKARSFTGKTLLKAIEKMLEYFLDNNLLPKE